jgi:hypothetical protein
LKGSVVGICIGQIGADVISSSLLVGITKTVGIGTSASDTSITGTGVEIISIRTGIDVGVGVAGIYMRRDRNRAGG